MPELNRIYQGDCIEVMKSWPENFIDTVICDPPYELNFMSKRWDASGIAFNVDVWKEALRVAKPGAMLLAFGGDRTHHRMMVAIEDAGWEIRTCLYWLFASGFPKSLNISKALDKRAGAEREVIGYTRQGPRSMFDGGKPRPATLPATLWDGYGTALKPAAEIIVMAMKPLEGTFCDNALKWGVAGLNVDGGRIESESRPVMVRTQTVVSAKSMSGESTGATPNGEMTSKGRWPANLILDEEAAGMLDGASGDCSSPWIGNQNPNGHKGGKMFGGSEQGDQSKDKPEYRDSGGASRFFYVAKSCRAERNEGCEEVTTWESEGLSPLMAELNRQAKDTSEDIMHLLEGTSWNTALFGKNTSEQFQTALMFTMSTMIKLTIELKTLPSSLSSTTKGLIRDAIETIKANGLNLAETAGHIDSLKRNTINAKTQSALGASLVVLKTLSAINDSAKRGCTHPTIKPLSLMKYLCMLTKTPTGGIVLDPFAGSGTTLWAAEFHNRPWIGIEMNPEYVAIANARIARERSQMKMGI